MVKTNNINTIVVITKKGNMPRLVAKYKPNAFIFAVSNNRKVLR
jgi:pyruvate kinase